MGNANLNKGIMESTQETIAGNLFNKMEYPLLSENGNIKGYDVPECDDQYGELNYHNANFLENNNVPTPMLMDMESPSNQKKILRIEETCVTDYASKTKNCKANVVYTDGTVENSLMPTNEMRNNIQLIPNSNGNMVEGFYVGGIDIWAIICLIFIVVFIWYVLAKVNRS